LRFCAASAILEKTKEESDGNAMLQFAIPCLLGLESLVGDEVKKLGLADVKVENGRVLSDEGFVFYGQQTSSDGSVRFQPSGADDRETITVDIARIDPRIRKIVFVLTIDEALTQKLHFGMLQNVYLRILDDRDGREILSYPLGNAFENVTSMTLGELYLHQGQWKFNPVGNGVHMDLAGQCALYGVTLA